MTLLLLPFLYWKFQMYCSVLSLGERANDWAKVGLDATGNIYRQVEEVYRSGWIHLGRFHIRRQLIFVPSPSVCKFYTVWGSIFWGRFWNMFSENSPCFVGKLVNSNVGWLSALRAAWLVRTQHKQETELSQPKSKLTRFCLAPFLNLFERQIWKLAWVLGRDDGEVNSALFRLGGPKGRHVRARHGESYG